MAADEQNKSVVKQDAAEDSTEISAEDLQSISGGLASSGGFGSDFTATCVSD